MVVVRPDDTSKRTSESPWEIRMLFPSGIQTGAPAPTISVTRRGLVPSAFMSHRSDELLSAPRAWREKAIWRPSGDHAGFESETPGSRVSSIGGAGASTRQM